MDLQIIDYSEDLDKELIELFDRSIFYKRKEFEYLRDPEEWIYRYKLSEGYITKIALYKNKPIASLGVIKRRGIVSGKDVSIGCFVDDCLLPEYRNNYEEIFNELFQDIEKEANKQGIKVLCGWDYLELVKKHENLYKSLGFTWVKDVNWFPGGSDLNEVYPRPVTYKVPWYWRLAFSLYKYEFKFREMRLQSLPAQIKMRPMSMEDIPRVVEFINTQEDVAEFRSHYTVEAYEDIVERNNVHGIIAENNMEIIGVLTYITSAWGGWMFRKPYYDKKWGYFYSYTPDEFVVSDRYRNTVIPARMALELMKIKDPERHIKNVADYSFIVDVFDQRIEWRRKALLSIGCFEPKFDQGAILAKSLDRDIYIDEGKPWSLPGRHIIAPVPSPNKLTRTII